MAGIYIFSQGIGLFRMLYHITIGSVTIVRHKANIVFPRSGLLIIHIIDDLIHHVGRLGHCPHRETPDTDIDLRGQQSLAVIAIVEETEVVVYHIRFIIQ